MTRKWKCILLQISKDPLKAYSPALRRVRGTSREFSRLFARDTRGGGGGGGWRGGEGGGGGRVGGQVEGGGEAEGGGGEEGEGEGGERGEGQTGGCEKKRRSWRSGTELLLRRVSLNWRGLLEDPNGFESRSVILATNGVLDDNTLEQSLTLKAKVVA